MSAGTFCITIFGYRHEDISTIESWALRAYPNPAYRAASKHQWEADVAEAVGNGTSTVPREYRITCLDGSQRDVEIVMRPVRGTWITVFSDITERKRAEDDLNAEREFFERALSAQLDTFFVFEADTGKALLWNKRFREVAGYSDEEISCLKTPDAYYDPTDLVKAAKAIERIMQEGSGTVELDLVCKDGRKIPFEYVASIMHANPGEPRRVISIGRDITERKKAEERLAHMHELMKYVISHAQSAIAVHDREMKYIYVSEQVQGEGEGRHRQAPLRRLPGPSSKVAGCAPACSAGGCRRKERGSLCARGRHHGLDAMGMPTVVRGERICRRTDRLH